MSKLLLQFLKTVEGDNNLRTVGYGCARCYGKSSDVQSALKKLPSNWIVEDRPDNFFAIQIREVFEKGCLVEEGWDRAFALARVFERAGLCANIEASYLGQMDEQGRYVPSGFYLGNVYLD